MNAPRPPEWHRLFSAALNGTLDDAEKTQLTDVLKTNAQARQLWFLYQDNECGLAELPPPAVTAPGSASAPRSAWLQWRPLVAAAAGLAIGLFSATVVAAYVGAQAARAIPLLHEGFESGPPPQVTGMPIEPGQWSGDYAEVVGQHQGVKPASGGRMLRFLRADYEGKPVRDGYVADLFRIIDLGSAEYGVARGDAWVSVEARFRSLPKDGLGKVRCGVTVHALDALPAKGERHDLFLKALEASAAGADISGAGANILATSSRHEVLPAAGGSWLVARNELRVPAGTRYFMIHLHESLADLWKNKDAQPVQFEGLFLDDIRVTLTHRPPLP